MDAHTLSSLEFYEILRILKDFAASELGKRECERIRPLDIPQQVEGLLTEVTELKEVIEGGLDLPLHGIEDIEPVLQRTHLEGAILTAQELWGVGASVRVSCSLKGSLRHLGERFSRLKEIGEEFSAPRQLAQEIERAIGPGGDIYDEASPHLKEVRGRIKRVRGVVQEKLEHLLGRKDLRRAFQDEVITQRNGRYVILIRADFKGRVKGIVHDYSQSRMSLYLEPMGVVEFNNELNVLQREQEEEEEKVLRRLTALVRERREELLHDLVLQGRVDAIYAKARFSVSFHGVQPALNTEGRVRLMAARHPLLIQAQQQEGEDEVVPIDLYMDRGQRILVISGANTGGKTVALKTLGLLSLMVQAGLHIPAAPDSEVNLFQDIFAHIGDEQNLQEHLSTFSSFILWLNRVLDGISGTSLLLIDEIGVGTEYSQGAALAMGLLDYVRQKGGYAVVTSHFNPLKAYAYRHGDVANVAVEFDEETLEPTYRLLYGRPGTSQTFLIAERLGLKGEVLERARDCQEGVQGDLEHLMGELEHLHRGLEREKIEAIRVREDAMQERDRLRRAAEEIQEKRRKLVKRTEEDGKRITSSLEARLREVLKKAEERKEKVPELKGEFKRIKEDFMHHFPKRRRRGGGEEIREGDQVEVISLGKQGAVVELSHDPLRAEVSIGGIRVKAPLQELRFVSREEEMKGEEMHYQLTLDPSDHPPHGELNVIGLRVDEALPKVEKFLDDALLKGWERVHIIHGIGSGRLREAIQGHLKGHKWVKESRGGELNEGGLGVTVVELR
ncbi:MAG: endonuclease MutS2 [Deltaproteobacteria bacterium]|nr:MAG: endonuclease MutS2 [Deltaproteobacteria bacterium]